MTDGKFEKYLDGDTPLSRAYRAGSKVEPPASIDTAVREALAAERNAVAARRSRLHEWHRFLVPMAAAATVLLSFSLVMQLVLDPGGEAMRMDDSIAMTESVSKKAAAAAEVEPPDAPVPQSSADTIASGAVDVPAAEEVADVETGRAREQEPEFAAAPPSPPADARTDAVTSSEPGPGSPVLADTDATRAESPVSVADDGQYAATPPGPGSESTAAAAAKAEGEADAFAAGEPETARTAAEPGPSVFADGEVAASKNTMAVQQGRAGDCDALFGAEASVKTRLAHVRCLVEAGFDTEARTALRELIDDEPAFRVEEHPDLVALMEGE